MLVKCFKTNITKSFPDQSQSSTEKTQIDDKAVSKSSHFKTQSLKCIEYR